MIEILIRYPIVYLPILAFFITPIVFRNLKNRMNLKQYVILLFSILAVENMLDYIFTMVGINAGCIAEANPIAEVLIENGSLGQFKGIASLYIVIVIALIVKNPENFTKRSEKITVFMASIYTALMVYHLIILFYMNCA